MEEEHALVEIDLCDGGTRFVVGRHVGQFIVGPESLSRVACPHTAREVILPAHDVVPYPVDGLDVGRVLGQSRHIGHAGIHVARPHGVSPSLPLLGHGLVALAVEVAYVCLASVVQKIFGLVEIAFVARDGVEAGQSHLRYLVSWHHGGLSLSGAHLTDDTVGIPFGYVEKLGAARGLIVGAGRVHHVAEVVELMTQHFHLLPSLEARPLVGFLGIDGASGVEIAVGFLGCPHHIEHAVDISLQPFVRIGLENIACPLDGLVDIGVVEGEAHEFAHVIFLVGPGRLDEVVVSPFALALAESQRHRHFAGGLQPITPKGVGRNPHTGERHLGEGIAVV